MTVLPRHRQLTLVGEAARAPSAHNTQPARWRFTPDGTVLLFEDVARRLPVGDPTGRDHLIGLGCAFEGLRLALSRRTLALGDPEPSESGDRTGAAAAGGTLKLVAFAHIHDGAEPDPLADQVTARRTYRGRFHPATAPEITSLRAVLDRHPAVTPVYDRTEITALCRLADQVSFRLLADQTYQAELYGWLRFSPGDPAWARDGLTAECLGLSDLERRLGRWLFVPRRFRRLARLGLHRALVAEAPRTQTATALAIVHRPRGPIDLTAGRDFYRFWLEVTRAGFEARPMSALVDDDMPIHYMRDRFGLPPSVVPVNVFAIGKGAPAWRAVSPRLPADELLV